MRAILRTGFGGPEKLVIREIPEPEPKDGHAVIEVKAFGLNHAELHMRKGEWAEIADVSGIECVGIVKSCPGGEFAVGTKVAGLMGGLGRTINGSYAESPVRLANVAPQSPAVGRTGGDPGVLCDGLDLPISKSRGRCGPVARDPGGYPMFGVADPFAGVTRAGIWLIFRGFLSDPPRSFLKIVVTTSA